MEGEKRGILENVFSKEEALKVCAQFLGETWENTSLDDFTYEVLSGGMANRLYICGIPEGAKHGKFPTKVLLRIFGSQYVDIETPYRTGCESSESVIFYSLSRHNLGPQMYGVFSGGRIEEFIPSHRITDEDLMTPAINAVVAKKLAFFHTLEMPINKAPMKIRQIIERIVASHPIPIEEVPIEYQMYAKSVLDFDIEAALDWFQSTLPKIKTRVVFSHNDTNRSNVLVKDVPEGQSLSPEDKIVLVDYEFASYNYRGMDIAWYLSQRCFNYSDHDHPTSGLSHPSEDERRFFIREYLKETKRIGKVEMDVDIDSEDNLLMETDFFTLTVKLLMIGFSFSYLGKITGFYEVGHSNVCYFVENKVKFLNRYRDQLA